MPKWLDLSNPNVRAWVYRLMFVVLVLTFIARLVTKDQLVQAISDAGVVMAAATNALALFHVNK